jgi:hypothetical protein
VNGRNTAFPASTPWHNSGLQLNVSLQQILDEMLTDITRMNMKDYCCEEQYNTSLHGKGIQRRGYVAADRRRLQTKDVLTALREYDSGNVHVGPTDLNGTREGAVEIKIFRSLTLNDH